MREIEYKVVVQEIAKTVQEANFKLPEDVLSHLKYAIKKERSEIAVQVLEDILSNAETAKNDNLPLCQDTGSAVFFIELGADVKIEGGLLEDAINEGTAQGYEAGYLRKSVCHPLTRENTGNNTPAIIHLRQVKGDKLRITYLAKGGGAENMSSLAMLLPADGKKGIVETAVETVRRAGAKPCPPTVIGIGIGGNFERSAFLAKWALRRRLDEHNPDSELAAMESEILERLNKLGIGPLGMGGDTTSLAVHIELEPCHIASLPVAINVNCHSDRRGVIEL